jgi:hypothetical protein
VDHSELVAVDGEGFGCASLGLASRSRSQDGCVMQTRRLQQRCDAFTRAGWRRGLNRLSLRSRPARLATDCVGVPACLSQRSTLPCWCVQSSGMVSLTWLCPGPFFTSYSYSQVVSRRARSLASRDVNGSPIDCCSRSKSSVTTTSVSRFLAGTVTASRSSATSETSRSECRASRPGTSSAVATSA